MASLGSKIERFNSRLREEATRYDCAGLGRHASFNSRLREEATLTLPR